ncbi:MAG TPA: mechanosensitive ion channel domain-containing protein [Acetobacteraceae bacterium]|nr:mechanosensitive ion channel domain-containing protein [Acetobacteraceae bacterium]
MRILLALLALLLLSPCRALAQPAPALTPAQARTALEVLNDPKKRAEVTATLEAIAKAQPLPAAHAAPSPPPAGTPPAPAAKKTTPAAEKPLALAPNSLGAQVLLQGEGFLSRTSADAENALHAMQSLPALWAWIVLMATNPFARGVLENLAWRLAVVMAVALTVEYLLRRLMRRPIAALEAPPPQPAGGTTAEAEPETETETEETLEEEPPTPSPNPVERAEAGETEPPERHRRISAWGLLRRLPLVLARLFLDLIPVLGFTLAGHLVAATTLGYQDGIRVILLAVVDAYALCAALLCVARMLLSPHTPRLRLFHLPDSLAAYLMRWIKRLVIIAVVGYGIAEVGLLLGLSDVAHRALLKANGFVLHTCLAIMVLQKQKAVRKRLRAPPDATGAMAWVRNALASVWHWIALFFLIASWLVWAVEIPNGFTEAVHFSIVTALVLIGGRLLLIVLDGFLDRALRVPPETAARYPGLEGRLRLYHPGLAALLRAAVYVVCLLALLQVYGLAAFTWFAESDLGNRLVSACGTMLVTLVLALVAWEAANAALQSHLAKLTKDQQITRSARLRTLLPLMRSALMITILVFAGLTVLSEIGINIAPLLAGAGIVGVAIGFGSQKLVQDFITGIFLLLENAMQVGEWVTVSGLSGTVEALSVRTIRLRAGDGSVHIIPFSSVTTVTNVNRGLGNASVSVSVDYDENTDRVCDTLKQIVTEMRAETDYATRMLSDLQLWGVDKVDGSEATIVGQVVCTDSGRWSVQREFNRRMKLRFQELGIRLYNPMRNVAITLPPAGPSAPGTADEDKAHEQARAAD